MALFRRYGSKGQQQPRVVTQPGPAVSLKVNATMPMSGILTRTMQLDWREAKLLGDVAVLDGGGLLQRLALHPLGGERAGGDGRPAAEGLELGVDDLPILVNFDLKTQTLLKLD